MGLERRRTPWCPGEETRSQKNGCGALLGKLHHADRIPSLANILIPKDGSPQVPMTPWPQTTGVLGINRTDKRPEGPPLAVFLP